MEEKRLCYGVEKNVFWTSLSCLRKSLTKRLLRFNNSPHYTTAFVEQKKNVCKDAYVSKMEKILSDTNTYEIVNKDPIKKLTQDLH